ncbi:MAG: hypothetical protein H0V17_05215 [Deltaproteobacteria bacterium]|nr:hypothetical protein [Deltaproteobacteria bacterium]
MGRLLIVIALVVGSSHARAESEPPPKPKSLLDAYLISVAATTGPVVASMLLLGDDARGTPATIGGVIATTALVFGPSAGHWYTGKIWTTGLTLRLAGAGVIGGLVVHEQFAPLDIGTLIVGGLAAVALWETGVIWDAVTLPSAVGRYNRERVRFAMVPFATERSTGLAIAGSF